MQGQINPHVTNPLELIGKRVVDFLLVLIDFLC